MIRKQNRGRDLERSVEKYLRAQKIAFVRIENYRCFKCGQVQNSKANGFPDFFCYSPIILAIECKTGAGKLSPIQKEVRLAMLTTGIDYLLVRDNIDALIKYFQSKISNVKKFSR